MLRNYFIIALRNLRKQKTYSFINIVGLTLGITSTLLLLLYVADELSYDRYHENADRIYRVVMDVKMGSEEREVAVAPPALGPALAKEYTNIEQYALIRPIEVFNITKANETIPQEDFFYASSTVFDVFSYHLLEGNSETALQEPNAIVITQDMADKLFPNQEVIGQTISRENGKLYKVTGLMENVPENGHFTPQALISIQDQHILADWGDWNWCNYVLAAPGFEPENFHEELENIYNSHLKGRVTEAGGENITFVMQPLTDIHFYSKRDFEMRANEGNMSYIYTFSFTAMLLLFIASINYMNLATARSLQRAREVGIRKAMGSSKKQLISQFLAESYLFVLLAFAIGLFLTFILLPYFNQFTHKSIILSFITTPAHLAGIAGFFIFLGLLAGSYPAFFLSKFNPATVLKGNHVQVDGKFISFRKILVVLQFAISIVMIICTWVVYYQISFLNQQDLGFNQNQIIKINMGEEAYQHFSPLKEALLKDRHIQHIATTGTTPGERPEINSFQVETNIGMQNHILQQIWVDHDFIPTLGIQVIIGKNFDERDPENTIQAGVLVNETLVEKMGWNTENAIGRKLKSEDWEDEVIGVVKNFHMVSLHNVVEPLVIRNWTPANQMLIRVNSQDISQTLSYIRQTWNEIAGKTALDYTFLDQHFQQQYEKDEKRGTLFAGFSFLTILIACLGLFGLASYSVAQRTKEIGIRKVMGAPVTSILWLLSKDYIILIVIALAIAIPVANYFIIEWLNNFAYKTKVHWWFFALPGLCILVIALFSVSQQTIKAATRNPVDSLRYE